jgi:hypothetical protein
MMPRLALAEVVNSFLDEAIELARTDWRASAGTIMRRAAVELWRLRDVAVLASFIRLDRDMVG